MNAINRLLSRLPRRRWYSVIYSVRHHGSGIAVAYGMRDRMAYGRERALERVRRELGRDYAGRAMDVAVWILRG